MAGNNEPLRNACHYPIHRQPKAHSLTFKKTINTSRKPFFLQEPMPGKITKAHWIVFFLLAFRYPASLDSHDNLLPRYGTPGIAFHIVLQHASKCDKIDRNPIKLLQTYVHSVKHQSTCRTQLPHAPPKPINTLSQLPRSPAPPSQPSQSAPPSEQQTITMIPPLLILTLRILVTLLLIKILRTSRLLEPTTSKVIMRNSADCNTTSAKAVGRRRRQRPVPVPKPMRARARRFGHRCHKVSMQTAETNFSSSNSSSVGLDAQI